LKAEEILIRWINYHLRAAGHGDKQIGNLGGDLKDSFALTHVLNQIDGGKCSLDPLNSDDLVNRAG
jgi:plastin-1